MLAPDSRTVATEILRPPAGFALEHAAITTYSLDLDVLLALPLAVLAQSDQGIEELLADPMLTLEALREAGQRLDIFVNETSIAVPHTNRALFAMLEECVHPVRAPNGGAFHPKVWVVRFVAESGEFMLRIAVVSRNLTYDRSWDTALVTEAQAGSKKPLEASQALADLLRALPVMAVHGLDDESAGQLQSMAEQAERTAFPAPARFRNPVYFEALGLEGAQDEKWYPWEIGQDLLAIAPFINRTGLDALVSRSTGQRTLISRREALDDLPESTLEAWNEVMVLSDAAIEETEEGTGSSDLHAKLIALERGRRVTWYLGSANFTAAAYAGRNVEVIASINGPNDPRKKTDGYGIQQFRESGFLNLCEPYRRLEQAAEDETLKQARDRLEHAQEALAQSDLGIECERDGDEWRWALNGRIELPDGVSVALWPVSVREDQAQTFDPPVSWPLPMSRLTAFVAFRLRAEADIADIRFVLKLPTSGMPEGRVSRILKDLIDTPERFLQFLRALLGGLDGMTDWATGEPGGTWQGDWGAGFAGETLLEDLVRAAARDPERLAPIRRLIEDLQSSPEGRDIVPPGFMDIWRVVDESVSAGNPE
ncbi:MAG: hypothetical protein CMP07_08115 [Xanthomonadales bacterium]|nr:hypothetical protein [Xanthomonadales bacterium]